MRLLKWLMVLPLFATPAWAAITEKYVTTAGAGAHDGSSEDNAYSLGEMITAFNAPATAGTRFNIKNGTYTLAGDITLSGDGTVISPLIIRGYNSSIGDLDTQGRTGGNGALNVTNFPVIAYNSGYRLNASGADCVIFQNLKFTGTVNNNLVIAGINCVFYRCYFDNVSNGSNATGLTLYGDIGQAIDCDAMLTGGSGPSIGAIWLYSGNTRAIGCRVIQSGGSGVSVLSGSTAVVNCVIANCSLNGIEFTATSGSAAVAIGNTIYACSQAGIAIANAALPAAQTFVGNHVTDCGTYAFYCPYSSARAGVFANNRTRDNTSGATSGFTDWAAATSWGHVTTDTGGASTDFTNAGSNDFSLITAAPGKASGLLLYMDIGALQRQEPAGGFGGVSRARVVNPQ